MSLKRVIFGWIPYLRAMIDRLVDSTHHREDGHEDGQLWT